MADINLSGVRAYADRQIRAKLNSGLFDLPPLLAYMAGKGLTDGVLGRPGVGAMIGKGRVSNVKRESVDGSNEVHVRFLTERTGGFKVMGQRDTTPSTGNDSQDQKVRSAYFRWMRCKQPIKVWNSTLLLAGNGKNKIADATDEAVDMAMEEMIEEIHQRLYTGNPSSQTDEVWDNLLGVEEAMHTTNTYGGVNRSTYVAWASNRVTTAKTATLSLIDDANIIQGLKKRGGGVDLVLCDETLYNKFKQEALARQGTLLLPGTPEMSEVGQLKEAVRYNGVTIVPDWKATASYVYLFTSKDWFFQTSPQENWTTSEFTDQSTVPGGDDAITANISLMARLVCERPWNQLLYTNVS
jgi:hypothetical protein